FTPKVGLKKPEPKREEYRIRIGKKSDPAMTVAGNDTASCMPFGSGKNNVYMFNPNCVQLVVERKTGTGEWRTAAQSVVNLDMETGVPTPELINSYQQQGTHLSDLIPEEKFTFPKVITCDNVEVAKNEEGQRVQNIKQVYERFFKEYLQEHAQTLGLDPSKVIIGTGYTPSNLGFKKVNNTYVPLAPMSYSDNTHETAHQIDTGLESPTPPTKRPRQVRPLKTTDAIATTALEGKAYHDNKNLLENLHGLQNNIIGQEIANQHFDRPNLSFLFEDEQGTPRGYMIAYEGVNADLPEVYISDLAADPKSKRAGGLLIKQFFQSYLDSYGTKDKPFLPIFTNARDQTSYQIIKRQFERLAKGAGILAELVITDTYPKEGEEFHDLRIFLGHSQVEIDEQKAIFENVGSGEERQRDYDEDYED
ncbi:hypothetical protein ACFLZY_03565, partial [Patescibacteria group bacterium]